MNRISKLLIAAALIAQPIFLQTLSANEFRGEPRGHMMYKMARHLDLTEQQQLDIKAIMDNARSERGQNLAAMENFREQMKAITSADEFDEAAFLALKETNEPMFEAMALSKAKTRHSIFKLLTDEQREKFLQMKEQKMGKRGKHKKRH